MKRIALAATLLFMTLISWAQTAGQDIYRKYSEEKKVSSVYISPSMFSIIKSLPGMDASEVAGIRSLTGFYTIEIENKAVAAKLANDVRSLVEKGSYELVMEAVDEDDKTYIYCQRENGVIRSIILLSEEPDETDFICIEGEMREEMLRSMMSEARD